MIRWLLPVCVLLMVFSSGCGGGDNTGKPDSGFSEEFNSIVHPNSFNFLAWEFKTLSADLWQKLKNINSPVEDQRQDVMRYFSSVDEFKRLSSGVQVMRVSHPREDVAPKEARLAELKTEITSLKPLVESTLASQITQILSEEGIMNPFFNRLAVAFPPVNFKLEQPLNMLIISPRDHIEQVRSIAIKQDLTLSEIEKMEDSLEKLDLSAAVLQIGGFGGSYPSFVQDNADLAFTINTAIEEWLHQYLAFKPLGFRYVLHLLGISKNEDITSLNETVVGVLSQELGKKVWDRYYADLQEPEQIFVETAHASRIDFNEVMRETRKKVNELLAQGEIDQAEQYMKQQQQYLLVNGYYIRKLNQAYFAFHSSYAYSPSSIDPIGSQVKTLRKMSVSPAQFLATASRLSSRQDLEKLVRVYIESPLER